MAAKMLSHIDSAGQARMVDVTDKPRARRRAVAESFVRLSRETIALITQGRLPKGDAIATARLAGIMAAKRAAELIPLCHPLQLTHVDVQAEVLKTGVRFVLTVSCTGETGVEMEALTASSVAALALYDMVKAVERGATIHRVRLLEKEGGKSGTYRRGRKKP